MAVKVRLMRIGGKGKPFYRVVAVDERKKRTGSYLELLGTYNPLTNPKEINLKQDRIDAWVKNGAQLSDGFLRIIGKAKQRPERKPKKDRGNNSSSAPQPAAAAPDEEVKAADTPAEQPASEEPKEQVAEEAAPIDAPTEEQSVEEQKAETSEDAPSAKEEEKAE